MEPFQPWHDLRHTALTHEAAAGNPHAYVQAKAGHSQSTITDCHIHAAQVLSRVLRRKPRRGCSERVARTDATQPQNVKAV